MPIPHNTTELDKLLAKRFWDDEECPYFDLILYGDGKVFPLSMMDKTNFGMCIMKSDAWIPISQLPNTDENKLNGGFASLFSKDFPETDLRISCGECFSSGGNGFISLSHLSSGELAWLAFFLESNPFDSVSLNDGLVVAKSTDGSIFSLDLNSPSSVNIIRPK